MVRDSSNAALARMRAAENGWRRREWRRSLSLVLVLASLLISAAPAWAASEGKVATRASKQTWKSLDLPHFTVLSAANEERTRQIGRDLELLQAMLSIWLGGDEVHSPVPTTIYVFASQPAFKPYKEAWSGGYFASRPHGNYVALTADPNYDTTPTLYHEYLHYFIRNNLPDIPRWLNEGLAEFYSTFSVEGKKVEVGRAIKHHQRWLSRHPELPLSAFFELDRESEEYNEGIRQGSFYAQSWGLVHYLMAGNQERSVQLMQFLELLGQEVEEKKAFAQAFGADYAGLEQELESYFQRPRLPGFRLSIDGLTAAAPQGELTPLSRSQVLIRLGDLLASVYPHRAGDAREHVLTALALDPDAESEREARELLARLDAETAGE